jgi:hypothetical protein
MVHRTHLISRSYNILFHDSKVTINSTYLDSDSFVVGRVGVDRGIVVGVAGIAEL